MASKTLTKEKNSDSSVDNIDAAEIQQETKPKKNKKKDKKKKKGKGLFFLLLIAVILGSAVAILGFNAGNIREKYLRNTLEKIPVVKNVLPPAKEVDEYSSKSKEQLITENKALTSENENLDKEKIALSEQITSLNQEITRLREIEAAQAQFRADKEEFDRLVALNDPNAYKNFYEDISPENAEQLYKEVATTVTADKELKNYVQTFENMKKDAAAAVLSNMISTDMDLVVRILNNISDEQRGAILSAMDPADAASVAKQMAPDTNN